MSAPPGRNGRGQYNVRVQRPGVRKKHDTPGVTSVLNLMAKDGLQWGAAKETAQAAVLEPSLWQHLPPGEAIEVLRKLFRQRWDVKADIGTIVHEIALDWAYGRTSDLAQLLEIDTKTGKERGWTADVRAEAQRKVDGCLVALEQFYREQRPKWHEVERTVVHLGEGITDPTADPDPETAYAGTFDGRASLRGHGSDVRLDWKTGGRYPVETILQLAAYDYAPWLGQYLPDGTLEALEPNTRAEKCAVVYLHDDGTYEVLELPVDDRAFARFMGLRRDKAWLKDMAKWEKENPAPELITPTTEKATAA